MVVLITMLTVAEFIQGERTPLNDCRDADAVARLYVARRTRP